MSQINMLLDEENELTFQVNIEGNRPGEASCRLRLDGNNHGLMFEANRNNEGEISVIIPPLNHVLKEGTYDMTLEVIVDDKYFEPLTLQGSFEKSVSVTAEAIVRTRKRKTNVSASTLVENKRKTKKPTVVAESSKPVSRKPASRKSTPKKQLTDKDIYKIIDMISKSQ